VAEYFEERQWNFGAIKFCEISGLGEKLLAS
jgi:hypothetical protein